MIDTDTLHSDDIMCVIDVHANYHAWTPSLAEWRSRQNDYEAKKMKTLFGRLARAPKRPDDAKEKFPDQNWFDTFVLDAATIPAVLAKVSEFEKEAKAFVTPQPGWQMTSEIQTVVYIGRPEQFCVAIPPRQFLPRTGMPWPDTLVDSAVTAEAIQAALDHNSPLKEKHMEAELRKRAAELDGIVLKATVAQAPIRIQRALRLKTP